jgi:hypothetical protein
MRCGVRSFDAAKFRPKASTGLSNFPFPQLAIDTALAAIPARYALDRGSVMGAGARRGEDLSRAELTAPRCAGVYSSAASRPWRLAPACRRMATRPRVRDATARPQTQRRRRRDSGPSCNPGCEQLATSEFEVEPGVLCGHGREAFSALVCAHAAVIPSLHCGAALDLRALRTRTSRRSKE